MILRSALLVTYTSCVLIPYAIGFNFASPSIHMSRSCQPKSLSSSECLSRTSLQMARSSPDLMNRRWFFPAPSGRTGTHGIEEEELTELERKSIEYAANLIRSRMGWRSPSGNNETIMSGGKESIVDDGDSDIDDNGPVDYNQNLEAPKIRNERALSLVRGRFLDLTCAKQGETVAESMFEYAPEEEEDVIRGAIIAIQSLLVMGAQVGVKGSPNQIKKQISHLKEDIEEASHHDTWDRNCVRRLKHDLDMSAGTQLLADLKRKRTTQGAFDLLVALNIFGHHEELSLLRSGFPTRFTEEEEEAARVAEQSTKDPDALLGLRQDFASMKVYTIDGKDTSDIDDGLSIQVLEGPGGTKRNRVWIHISDADRWAPRDSDLFQAAKVRSTSVYLPTGSVPMFPSSIGNEVMSLRQGCDCCAISLGLEVNDDGSIDPDSIIVTPSKVQVSYRLTYDEVDDMFDAGVGYFEEWELGAMLSIATKRRELRAKNGSSEGRVTRPIPQASLKVVDDVDSEDNIRIELDIEVTHNAGSNQTSIAEAEASDNADDEHAAPASQAFLLVTEMMIMAGEAIGKWRTKMLLNDRKTLAASDTDVPVLKTDLELPFRSQVEPDFRARASEVKVLQSLKETKNFYPHAWYFRRFFKPVKVTKDYKPHFGLGLECYVQWSSPIRRFSDLQAHAAIKRYLRRKRVNKLLRDGHPIPSEITSMDLGCEIPAVAGDKHCKSVDSIDYRAGQALGGAVRAVQRNSEQYWMFEYVRRMIHRQLPEEVSFECIVLGCVDPERLQYAVYVKELGLEHRYLSEMGSLKVGQTLWLRVATVNPRSGLLTLSLASRASGMADNSNRSAAAAA